MHSRPWAWGASEMCFCFFEMGSFCCPSRSTVARSQLTAASTSWAQVILPPQPPECLLLVFMMTWGPGILHLCCSGASPAPGAHQPQLRREALICRAKQLCFHVDPA
uniref:Uncharacterized protein n=1 Tax=Homo sapiens TaxID=9606 RepID=Q6YL35_HUMAN|nr:unknown [Homo sapiens]